MQRILKPGGTFVATVWEHLSIELLDDAIMERVLDGEEARPRTIHHTALATPHFLEERIEEIGLSVINIDHDEYPFHLSSPHEMPNFAFEFVTLPIKEDLGALVTTGKKPYAFEDARKAFDNMISKGDLVSLMSDGRVLLDGNRYKLIVARRNYEDGDTLNMLRRGEAVSPQKQWSSKASGDGGAVTDLTDTFDAMMLDTYCRLDADPYRHIVTSVQNALKHHDLKRVTILDIATGSGQLAVMMAEAFPEATLYATDRSPEAVEKAKRAIREKELVNVTARVADVQDLSAFHDGSIDIITCSFGMPFFSQTFKALHEIHRVLKPGGTFITTVWDSIALDRIADAIMEKVGGQDKIPVRTLDLLAFSTPMKLESMIEDSDLKVLKVDHEEFPLKLMGQDIPEDFAFNAATLPI